MSSKQSKRLGKMSAISSTHSLRHSATSLDLIYSDNYNEVGRRKISKGSKSSKSNVGSGKKAPIKAYSDTDARAGRKKKGNRVPLPTQRKAKLVDKDTSTSRPVTPKPVVPLYTRKTAFATSEPPSVHFQAASAKQAPPSPPKRKVKCFPKLRKRSPLEESENIPPKKPSKETLQSLSKAENNMSTMPTKKTYSKIPVRTSSQMPVRSSAGIPASISTKTGARASSEPRGMKSEKPSSFSCFGGCISPEEEKEKQSSIKHSESKPEEDRTPNEPSEPKKKLVVRGLRKFRESHARPSSNSSYPPMWSREFPWKGRFHPDNYIYEWGEGPKAPVRPLTAMAKCRRHGGRCDNCGVFSRDICQRCRQCELDCSCPDRSKRGAERDKSCPYPFPTEAYKEVFGGDGWKKTCKVLCDLTSKDRRNPVGSNVQKPSRCCGDSGEPCSFSPSAPISTSSTGVVRGRNPLSNKSHECQINVLNPYNIPINAEEDHSPNPSHQYMMPPSQYPMPMMAPMYSMPMMPFMTALPPPPPVMPYFSPPCSYDPFYGSPSPFPPTDAFMPMQNY